MQKQNSELRIFHDLNNRVEHKLRMSVYVFDKERCMYPDKTASKPPLNVAVLGEIFKVNHKTQVRRQQAEQKRYSKTRYEKKNERRWVPKRHKNGQLLLPPYLWFTEGNSTPDPKGLAGGVNVQPSTSSVNQQNSTPDLRQRRLAGEFDIQSSIARDNIQSSTADLRQTGLAGESSHINLNTFLQANNNQDRRSVLIDESTIIKRRLIIDDIIYKPSVYDRLGSGKTKRNKTNKESENRQDTDQRSRNTTSSHSHNQYTSHTEGLSQDKRHKNNNHPSYAHNHCQEQQ